jgi:hypothetical protein
LCVKPGGPPPPAMPRNANGEVQPRPRPSSGCGGCAGAPAAGISGALLSIGALALFSVRRRGRRRT